MGVFQMKKKILIVGENSYIEELLILNNYLILKEADNDLVDLVVMFEKKEVPKYVISNEKIPVILFGREEKMEKFKYNNEFEFISERNSNSEIINKIKNMIDIRELQSENRRLQLIEKELISKLQVMNAVNQKLFIKSKEMEARAEIDTFSNMYNKKYMIKRIREEQSKIERFDRNFAIAVIEADTKSNEKDEFVLKKCAAVLSENIRSSDIAGAMRENTFIVIFPEIIEKYTINVMKKIICELENIKYRNQEIITYSGFFVINKETSQKFGKAENIISILEKLLYFAKESEQKIVEYCEEKIESVEKIKKYIEEIGEDKRSMLLDELSKSQKFIEKLLPKSEKWKNILDYSYLYTPFNFIGGDFFDFAEIDKNKNAVLFCDVSGHGVSSALYITAIKYIFKNLVQKENIIEPAKFLEKFNQNISDISEGNIFVTTIFGIIDKEKLKFIYGFGGGTSPIKIDCKNKEMKVIDGNGIAVGLVSEASFETKEESFNKGDILFFYSDGIYEFLMEKKVIKEHEEFLEIVKSCIDSDEGKFISKIYEVIQSKIEENVDFDDDITLLAIKF